MKVGDLVRDKRDKEMGVIVGHGFRFAQCKKVWWPSVGIKLIHARHLEVISCSQ